MKSILEQFLYEIISSIQVDKKTKNKIIEHYTKLYAKFGDNPASIGWPKGKQNIRFSTISQLGNLNNSSVLDVGCGFGDFSSFLKLNNINLKKYLGVDINKEFIDIAKIKNPDATFKVLDIEKDTLPKFDWSVAIGITNKSGSYRYIEKLLKRMLDISKKGVAMDFLSTYVDYKTKGTFHTSPEHIFKIAKKLSKRVAIRHDYLPFEFCVYLYKQDQIDKDLSFKYF